MNDLLEASSDDHPTDDRLSMKCAQCGFPIRDIRYKRKPAGVDYACIKEYVCPYCKQLNPVKGLYFNLKEHPAHEIGMD